MQHVLRHFATESSDPGSQSSLFNIPPHTIIHKKGLQRQIPIGSKQVGEKNKRSDKEWQKVGGMHNLKTDTFSFYKKTMRQTKPNLICPAGPTQTQSIKEMCLTNTDLKTSKGLEFVCDLLFFIRV